MFADNYLPFIDHIDYQSLKVDWVPQNLTGTSMVAPVVSVGHRPYLDSRHSSDQVRRNLAIRIAIPTTSLMIVR